MRFISAILATAIAILCFASVAKERIHAYGLPPFAIDYRTAGVIAGIMLVRGIVALRGAAGIDTSLLFAIAAVAAITDLQYGYVFDRVLAVGGTAIVLADAVRGDVMGAFLGAVSAAAIVALPWALSRARGMGLGDVKMAGVLGCGLGFYGAMRAIWYAFVLGAVFSIGCIVTRRCSRGDALPFAPFIALGAVLSTLGAAW